MKHFIILVGFLLTGVSCLAADPEAQFRNVETLCREGKVKEGRELLFSIQIPTNRIDLALIKAQLDLDTRVFIGVNLHQLVNSQQDQDAPLTWGLKIMLAEFPQRNTNEALRVYTAFTNRFAGVPGITNTYYWRKAVYVCQEIRESVLQTVQEGKSNVPSKAEPHVTPETR